MKMATKKKSKIIEVWNKVGYAKDVKDTTISIPDFLAFVKENTPANVKEEDITLVFECSEEPYYYDEIITQFNMWVAVRGTKEVNW